MMNFERKPLPIDYMEILEQMQEEVENGWVNCRRVQGWLNKLQYCYWLDRPTKGCQGRARMIQKAQNLVK